MCYSPYSYRQTSVRKPVRIGKPKRNRAKINAGRKASHRKG